MTFVEAFEQATRLGRLARRAAWAPEITVKPDCDSEIAQLCRWAGWRSGRGKYSPHLIDARATDWETIGDEETAP